MARYEIIDEPRTKPWGEKLIVDPIVILLAAILVPLIWQPPMLGRFWIPALWLILNGYLIGSSTLGKEIATIIIGTVVWFLVSYGVLAFVRSGASPVSGRDAYEYLLLLQFAVFFLAMYLVVFRQADSYALFKYMRGGKQ
jgi:hypothetical protein